MVRALWAQGYSHSSICKRGRSSYGRIGHCCGYSLCECIVYPRLSEYLSDALGHGYGLVLRYGLGMSYCGGFIVIVIVVARVTIVVMVVVVICFGLIMAFIRMCVARPAA